RACVPNCAAATRRARDSMQRIVIHSRARQFPRAFNRLLRIVTRYFSPATAGRDRVFLQIRGILRGPPGDLRRFLLQVGDLLSDFVLATCVRAESVDLAVESRSAG